MKSEYVIWGLKMVPDACVLGEMKGLEEEWMLLDGVPLGAEFPKDVTFRMDPDFPHNTVMTDSLRNTDMLVVGSDKLARFLQGRKVQKVEYLPLAILNHKKKLVTRDYSIIHPTEPIECLDAAKSGAQWSKIDKDAIDKVKRLVIDERKIPPGRELFRPKSFYRVVLCRRTLADAITAEGFTGIRWTELEEYKVQIRSGF